MDFFSATAAATDALPPLTSPSLLPALPNNRDVATTDAFAEAINARYSRKGSNALIPLSPAASSCQPSSTTPPDVSLSLPPPVKQSPSMPPPTPRFPTDDFTPVSPASLRDQLDNTLVIDIRPHNAYALARIPDALSLSVPSTLLKRPLFSLDKLAQMLPSTQARDKFSQWPHASSILIYDADSGVLNETGNLVGLLRKFRKEGYTRKLSWLKGGFKAVWREALDFVDQTRLVEEDEVPTTAAAAPTPAALLRTKHLPMSAFTMDSTTTSRQVPLTPAVGRGSTDPMSLRLPQIARTASTSTSLSLSLHGSASTPSFSKPTPLSLHLPLSGKNALTATIPEGKTLHLFPPTMTNASSSLPTSGMSAAYNVLPRPHYKSMPSVSSMAFNPFFDNIRQNIELGVGRGSGEGIPLMLPRRVRRRVEELPFEWLRDIGRRSGTLDDGSGHDQDQNGEVVEDRRKGKGPETLDLGSAGPITNVAKIIRKRQNKKVKKHTNSSRLRRSPSSSSYDSTSPPPDSSELSYSASASKANSKAGSVSPSSLIPIPSHSPQLQTTSGLAQDTRRESSEGESGDDFAKTLAMQFYKIELGEQRRLMGVMEHHSKESMTVFSSSSSFKPSASSSTKPKSGGYAGLQVLPGPPTNNGAAIGVPSTSALGSGSSSGTVRQAFYVPSSDCADSSTSTLGMQSDSDEGNDTGLTQPAFPYSITAGVEKGEKNRYRNIWPFEHARVRLQKSCPEDDDYMNASYVQPLGTNKRYIATQGPLPATFTDFWTLCWQENVRVIVMLTREVESALIKCGNYWAEGDYGSLSLKLISTTDNPEREKRRKDREMSSGFFNFPQVADNTCREDNGEKEEHTIRRVFELRNRKYPGAKPRIVTQLQYLEWPDLDVPKDPGGLLELMKQVDEVVEGAREEGDMQWGEGPWDLSPLGTPPKEDRPSSVGPVGVGADVDPVTGVAKHAMGRAPVLLHCSAGVGRTGGFIAVDAILDGVRREIRKREQMKAGVESGSSSQSRSPLLTSEGEHEEGMDVDRGIASPLEKALSGTGLTMSMEVGGNEVHVPIAGLSNGQAPMDVDDDGDGKVRKDGRVLEASPALIEEARNGHAKFVAGLAGGDGVLTSSPLPVSADARAPDGVGYSDTSTGSGVSSTHRSTSLSGNSIVSSSHTSTTSLTQAMKGVDPSLGSGLRRSPADQETPLAQTSRDEAETDSWRNVVSSIVSDIGRRSHMLNALPDLFQGPKWVQDTVLASPRGATFDYVEPRRLHDNGSPPLLSSYDEPIRRVIEDMREQRMSLCQSLRQYVFVHRAIIEGALRLMDEAKCKRRVTEDIQMALPDVLPAPSPKVPPTSAHVNSNGSSGPKANHLPISPMPLRPPGLDRVESMELGSALVLDEHVPRGSLLSQVVSKDSPLDAFSSPSSSCSPRAKRQASPTELVSEDAKGVPRLTKRASVKRRPMTPLSGKDEDGGVPLGSLMLSSPPPTRSR